MLLLCWVTCTLMTLYCLASSARAAVLVMSKAFECHGNYMYIKCISTNRFSRNPSKTTLSGIWLAIRHHFATIAAGLTILYFPPDVRDLGITLDQELTF